ncbi:MAG: hypothetical protein AAF789_12320 [Bacteroidota bacterium]
MKKGLLILYFALSAISSFCQGRPWYDFEAVPICWDSAGVARQLFSVKLYRVGRDTAMKTIFTDETRKEVVPTEGNITPGFCGPYNPEILTDYDSHVQIFGQDSPLTEYTPVFSFNQYREVLIYNYTNCIIRVNYLVSGVPGLKKVFLSPFATHVLPQPQNLSWNHVHKFSIVSVSSGGGINNVGTNEQAPHVIITVKNY